MCVICVKRKGVKLPTVSDIKDMWARNPDGAGFMYAKDGHVIIEKGFMTCESLIESIKAAGLTDQDAAVFHFRISTQAGIKPTMCHPFPLSGKLTDMEMLATATDVGIAHNGIIDRTTCRNKQYSDTALFITRYISQFIRDPKDTSNKAILEAIEALAPQNKFAIMTGTGKISTVGTFYKEKSGLMYSNLYHRKNYIHWWKNWKR